MKEVEQVPLFGIDVIKTRATHHDKIQDYIMEHVFPYFEKNGPNDPVQNTFTDYGMHAGAAFCHWPYLYKLYEDDVRALITGMGFDLNKHQWDIKMKGWYNLSYNNEAEFLHDHTGGPSTIQFAAVHYVKLAENSYPTAFKNPLWKYIKASIPTKNIDYIPSYFYDFDRLPDAKEGDIVLFPSWLDHYVPKHTNGTLRITNALNIMMRVDNGDGN